MNLDGLKRLVIGVSHDPAVVAAVRALLFYGVPLGGEALIGYLAHLNDPRWLGVAGASIMLIRALEGAVDRALKPTQNATYPRPPAGEKQPPPVPPA